MLSLISLSIWFYSEVASDYSFLFSLKVFAERCQRIDSLTFQLSSLALLKGKKNENLDSQRKRAISKTSINDISFSFQIVYVRNKNCANEKSKTKIVVAFIYSYLYFLL